MNLEVLDQSYHNLVYRTMYYVCNRTFCDSLRLSVFAGEIFPAKPQRSKGITMGKRECGSAMWREGEMAFAGLYRRFANARASET
jgi:hypothetical protein